MDSTLVKLPSSLINRASMSNKTLFDDACACIVNEADALNEISQTVWKNPELNFEERHAHHVLCNFLEERGFKVERSYKGVETAFKASWNNLEGTSPDNSSRVPHVVFIAEYDALPEIGHACGHNLISEIGLAAGLGTKAAMEKHGKPLGKITVMGTPAEEGGGGKIKLIEKGAFDDVDIALMVHPTSLIITKPTVLCITDAVITFKGIASHAAASPWEGLNALDAAVMAYNGLSVLRQQLKPSIRIHAIISKGGVKPNIIPDHTQMEIYIRALTTKDLDVVKEKVINCFKGAAMATGCQMDAKFSPGAYQNMIHNDPLIDLYEKHMRDLDPDWSPVIDSTFSGSTDMGNVSHVVPSIHPFYCIGAAPNHTREFATISGSPGAQLPTLTQGKALAMIALDVMSDHQLLQAVKTEFDNTKEK